MRLSISQVKALKALLKEQTGRDYEDEEIQQAGLAIMRLVVAKHQRSIKLTNSKDKDNAKTSNNRTKNRKN